MSNTFIKLLIVAYTAIAVTCVIDREWARFRYFVGAIILSWGLLGMR